MKDALDWLVYSIQSFRVFSFGKFWTWDETRWNKYSLCCANIQTVTLRGESASWEIWRLDPRPNSLWKINWWSSCGIATIGAPDLEFAYRFQIQNCFIWEILTNTLFPEFPINRPDLETFSEHCAEWLELHPRCFERERELRYIKISFGLSWEPLLRSSEPPNVTRGKGVCQQVIGGEIDGFWKCIHWRWKSRSKGTCQATLIWWLWSFMDWLLGVAVVWVGSLEMWRSAVWSAL